MSEPSAGPKKKIPVWIWIAGGVVVLAMLGTLFGGDDAPPEAQPEPAPAEISESAPEMESDTAGPDFAIATVQERYESDCFANLGDSFDYRYEESRDAMREGYVYVRVGEDVLQFAVGLNESAGTFLTSPANEFTVEKLDEAGC